MKISVIDRQLSGINRCQRCGMTISNLHKIDDEHVMVRCVGCGSIETMDTDTIHVKCPKCDEMKLNIKTGKCENCQFTTKVELPYSPYHKYDTLGNIPRPYKDTRK